VIRSPLAAALSLLIQAYQRFLSPFTGASCRFYPSCSQYALEAINEHGALKGTWLAFRRVTKCHPFNPGGVDHIPPSRKGLPR
jgi:hypothetical protein